MRVINMLNNHPKVVCYGELLLENGKDRPAFWWLEYYKEWHEYLRSKFSCLWEHNMIAVFDLRPKF